MLGARVASLRRLGVPLWAMLGILAFALLGPLVFVGIGLYLLVEAQRFAEGAVPLAAEVVRVETERDGDGVFHRPVFAFTTPDGRAAEAPLHSASTQGMARGTEVTILYNPEQPEEVRLAGFWHVFGFGAVFLGLGLLVELLFIWGLWRFVIRSPPFAPPPFAAPPGAGPDGWPQSGGISEERRAALREKLRNRRR